MPVGTPLWCQGKAAERRFCRGLFFIVRGAVRSYALKEGVEISHHFYFENDFASDFESITLQQPSRHALEALEETTVIYCDREKMLTLYKQATVFESIGKTIVEQMMIRQNAYSSLFTLYAPAERYQFILEHHPNLVQRVPLQHLATYLGVARETLSRIRKRIQ
ncbi:Crp/Fnr family transcriptional regulator [Chryseolinea lacunae]|uniref:Crp/Fnr family transcriptional regulator n=1 Tax=Chryseolinea lacunae TaxID=2801331 RepID=A0ABS1KVQ2_9BACT|nr:Crp/Fnr family transcriptional regulator [Chryseolinea lacunae]MBL0743327.1 Crp/Fnr family transcriptional regulator [Chryseolinea lacunae]